MADRDIELDPDAPPTEEETAASQKLRDALEGAAPAAAVADAASLAGALRAAWSPAPLDERVHAELLDELPTAEELALAERLRDELARDTAPELVAALRSAWSPAPLDDAAHRAIVAGALQGAASRENVVPLRAAPPRTSRLRTVFVATSTVLALAAGVVLWLQNAPRRDPTAQAAPALAKARSTQPLFGEHFNPGETSARIDTIALARASDYRDNRFAKWGVR